MALRDKDVDLTKEYNPSDNTLENEELNSTRFKQSYISFLDLLYNLYPNAYGTQLLAKYGLPTELTEEVPNLSAEKLDWLLDVDHFAKDIKVGSKSYDLSKKENREHFVKLFKTAVALFSTEDDLKMSLPDFGDTSISKTNGGSTITYGKDYLLSNMDSRYSDMKFYGKDTGKVDGNGNKVYEEVNGFSFDKLKYTDDDKNNLLNFARIFDINNDGLIGTDDAVLILVAYAYFLALKDSSYRDIIKTTTEQALNQEYVNSSYLGDFDKHKGANLLTKNKYTPVTDEKSNPKRVYYFYQSNHNNNSTAEIYNPKTGATSSDKISVQLYLSSSSTEDNISTYLVSKANALEKIRKWGLFSNLQFKNKNSAEAFNSEISVFILQIITKKHNYTKQYVTIDEFADELAKMFKLGNLKVDDFVDSNGDIVDNGGKVYAQGSGTNAESVVSEGWNESINGLYSLLKDWSKNYGLTPREGIDPKELVKELKEADAKGDGENDTTLLHPVPFTNLLKQNYKQARRDEIKQNDVFMDYTNRIESADDEEKVKIVKEIMNLIMPAYKRRVEVEDLDKNFWVISTVVGSLVDVLFGNDGLRGVLKGQTAEVMELWNNVKYLWNIIDVQAKMINDLALANSTPAENDTERFAIKKDLYEYKTEQQLNTVNLENMSAELLDINGDGYISGDDATLILANYAAAIVDNVRIEISWTPYKGYPMTGSFKWGGEEIMKIGLKLWKQSSSNSEEWELINNVDDYQKAITNKTSSDNYKRSAEILEFNKALFKEKAEEFYNSVFTIIDDGNTSDAKDDINVAITDTNSYIKTDGTKYQSKANYEHITFFYRGDTNNSDGSARWFRYGSEGHQGWDTSPIGKNNGRNSTDDGNSYAIYIPLSLNSVGDTNKYDLVYYNNKGIAESNDGRFRYTYSQTSDASKIPQTNYLVTHFNKDNHTFIHPKIKRCHYQAGGDGADFRRSFNFIFCRDETAAPKRMVNVPNWGEVDLIYRKIDTEEEVREKIFLKYILASFWVGSSYQQFNGSLDSRTSVAIMKMVEHGNFTSLDNASFNDEVYKKYWNEMTKSAQGSIVSYDTSEMSLAQLNTLMVLMENDKGEHYDISYSAKRRLVTVESKDGKTISAVTVKQDENYKDNANWAKDKKNLPYIPNEDMGLIKEDARATLNGWYPDYKVGDSYPAAKEGVVTT